MKEYIKEYAVALFDTLLMDNQIEQQHVNVEIVSNILSNNPDLTKFLSHPQITKTEKKELIDNVFKELDLTIKHFLFVLIDNNRIQEIEEIYKSYYRIYNEYNQILTVIAVTSVSLTEKETIQLKEKLTKKYKKKIKVTNTIDQSIIGGMRLMINDQVIDNTIISHLTNLKSYVLKQN